MIGNESNINSFIRSSGQFHRAGIEKYGKTYKQRSHTVLVSAFFNIIDRLNTTTSLEIGAFQAEFSRQFISNTANRHALAVEALSLIHI